MSRNKTVSQCPYCGKMVDCQVNGLRPNVNSHIEAEHIGIPVIVSLRGLL